MSLDLTGLSKYVELASQDIVTSGLINGSETYKHLVETQNMLYNVKGEASLLTADADVNLQDDDGCTARSPLGSIRLADGKIKTHPLKDVKDICTKTLKNTYFSWLALNNGSYSGEELNEKFAQFLGELRTKKIAGTVEKMFWQGDINSTDFNLKKFDGLIKIKGGTPTVISGANMVQKLQNVVKGVNQELIKNEDFHVFVSYSVYNTYLMDLANMNIYNQNDLLTIYGTTVKMVVVSGLDGTDLVCATRSSNIKGASDGDLENHKIVLKHEPNGAFSQDVFLAPGITFYTKDEATFFDVV